MKYVLKSITHFDFFDKLEKYFSRTIELLEKKESDKKKYRTEANKIINEIELFIEKHIYPESVFIINLFNKSYNGIFNYNFSIYASKNDLEIQSEVERLDNFRQSFRNIIGYLSMTESLIDEKLELNIKTISDKNDFILSKLNSVFGDEMYSISIIFELNNIKFRDNETREIVEDLSNRGYLILKDHYMGSDKAKISVKGARYIERKLKINRKQNISELDKKIDIIIEQLTKLGFGQEIIFNEIDELRGLQNKLSKKSWSQLLKGKLVDLALDKLITVEIAKTVYEYLTSNDFKLLK